MSSLTVLFRRGHDAGDTGLVPCVPDDSETPLRASFLRTTDPDPDAWPSELQAFVPFRSHH